jgi:hypothetical protein
MPFRKRPSFLTSPTRSSCSITHNGSFDTTEGDSSSSMSMSPAPRKHGLMAFEIPDVDCCEDRENDEHKLPILRTTSDDEEIRLTRQMRNLTFSNNLRRLPRAGTSQKTRVPLSIMVLQAAHSPTHH